MYKVGDIVEIHAKHKEHAMPDSPVLNLEGSIVEIRTVSFTPNRLDCTYQLKMIELKANKEHLYDPYQMDMAWKDDHLVPVVEYDIKADDMINVFSVG